MSPLNEVYRIINDCYDLFRAYRDFERVEPFNEKVGVLLKTEIKYGAGACLNALDDVLETIKGIGYLTTEYLKLDALITALHKAQDDKIKGMEEEYGKEN